MFARVVVVVVVVMVVVVILVVVGLVVGCVFVVGRVTKTEAAASSQRTRAGGQSDCGARARRGRR